MKGHTNEDCDQLFSRFGVKLSDRNVVTVKGIIVFKRHDEFVKFLKFKRLLVLFYVSNATSFVLLIRSYKEL